MLKSINTLKVSKLSFSHGSQKVVDDLSFCVESGQAFTLVGANGSGKSTILRLLAGILPTEDGHIDLPSQGDYANLVAYLGHKDGLHPHLSAIDNLSLDLSTNLNKLHAVRLLNAWGIEKGQLNKPHANLSQGQRKRVSFALLEAKKAKVWLLDEPLHNLDPNGQNLVQQAIAKHAKAGGIIIQTQHQVPAESNYINLKEICNVKTVY